MALLSHFLGVNEKNIKFLVFGLAWVTLKTWVLIFWGRLWLPMFVF